MKVMIKMPTKGRKEKFFSTLDIFYNLCENPKKTHFLITLDYDDEVMNNEEVRQKLNTYLNLNYTYGESISKLSATNRDLDNFNDWDILILASDDTIPIVKGYDEIIRNNMIKFFPDTDGVLHFNDGHQKENLNTCPILGKKYFDRFGYVQYPEYKSCFADNEFMRVSQILGKSIYFDQVIIEHQHPDWGFGNQDFVHHENRINLNHDQSLFQRRQSINFNL
jgi:hypothetical protein